jgi:hypothetical protein
VALRPLVRQAQWQTIDWRSELLEPTGELKSDILPVPKELPKELAELGDKLKAVQLPTPTLPPIERDSPFASLIQREVQARSTGDDAERLPVPEGPPERPQDASAGDAGAARKRAKAKLGKPGGTGPL